MSEIEKAIESHRILGVGAGAPFTEVRQAYRRLMKRWHPDVCHGPEAEERSKSIIEAFECLQDLNLGAGDGCALHRAEVHAKESGSSDAVQRAWRPRFSGRPRDDVDRRSPRSRPGRNIAGSVTISARERRRGARWRFKVPTCRGCGGWGAADDSAFQACPTCLGLGFTGRTGTEIKLTACARCAGMGCAFETPCLFCRGSGASTFFAVRCSVLAGTDNGWGVLEGLGHPGVGGARPGDLFLRIRAVPSVQ